MKTQTTDDRVRPGFVVLLVGGLAVILIPAWLLTRTPPAATAPAVVKAAPPVAEAPAPAMRTSGYAARAAAARAAVSVPVPLSTAPTTPVIGQHMAPLPRRSVATRQEKWMKLVGAATPSATGSTLEDRWGIQVCSLGLSMGNAMLDMRYKVVDPGKAISLVNGNTRAFVFDPASGATLFMPSPPKEGAFPPSGYRLAAGKTYFAAVANQRGVLKSGSKVSLVIGDCVLSNLTIN